MKKTLIASFLVLCMVFGMLFSVAAFGSEPEGNEETGTVQHADDGSLTQKSEEPDETNETKSEESSSQTTEDPEVLEKEEAEETGSAEGTEPEAPEEADGAPLSESDPEPPKEEIALRTAGSDDLSEFERDGFTLSTAGEYPWVVVEKDGGDALTATYGSEANPLSTLAVVFSETGVFSCQYSTSTSDTRNWLAYSFVEITNSSDYSLAENQGNKSQYSGTHDWTDLSVNVEAGQTLYFVYAKKTTAQNEDVWLRNLSLSTGDFSVSVSSSDDTYGTAEASAYSVAADAEDKTITLTATPENGGRFYGWVINGHFYSANEIDDTYEVQANTNVVAYFGSADQYEARVDGTFYTDVTDAIAAADDGTSAAPAFVVLTNDAEINGTVSLNPYTVFVLPYSDLDANVDLRVNTSERPYSNGVAASPASTALTPQGVSVTYTLTVADGATLTVPATAVLAVGGIYSGGQPIGGQVCGAHSEIDVKGTLNINGGILSCNGYIYGNGSMNVTNGTVYENFTVTDFNGGGIFVQDATQGLFPFTTYTVMGIQCETTFDANSYLKAYCALYVSSTIMQIPVEVVGGEKALIQINSGTAVMTYDTAKFFTVTSLNGTPLAEIGTLNIKMYGDGTVGAMRLSLAGFNFNTQEFECPLPYCITIEQVSGTLNVTAKLKIMPGSQLIIDEDATLNVGYGGSINALVDSTTTSNNAYTYPGMEALMANGYFPVAEVVVAGTLNVEDGAGVGGMIMMLDGGTINVSGYADARINQGMEMLVNVTEDELVVGSSAFMQLMGLYLQAMGGDQSAYAALMARSAQIEGGFTYLAENGSISSSPYNNEPTYTDTITFVNYDYLDYANEHEGSVEGYVPLATVTQDRHTELTYPGETPVGLADEDYGYNYIHYTFVGWNKVILNAMEQLDVEREGGLLSSGDPILYTTLPDVNGDAVYMAVYEEEWLNHTYTFTFEDGVDGEEITMPANLAVTEGYAEYSAVTAPTRPGYTFAGWKYTKDSYTVTWLNNTIYTSNLYYNGSVLPSDTVNWVAQWSIKTYTVTWVDDNNQVIETDNNVPHFSKPSFDGTEPTKDGFTFIGWQDTNGNALTEDTIVTGNVTFRPVWQAEGYSVTIVNKASSTATLSLATGDICAANDTFTVTSVYACVVAISYDSGESYEELSCTADPDANTYVFTLPADLESAFTVGVILLGDANENGTVDAADGVRITRWYAGVGAVGKNNTLSALGVLAADANRNGSVDTSDRLRITRWFSGIGNPGKNNTLDWNV